MLNYRLAVLTHSDDGHAREAIDSFLDNVTPSPVDGILYCDGPDAYSRKDEAVAELDFPWRFHGNSQHQQGFCQSTNALWRFSSRALIGTPSPTHVFWLEHDFRFVKRVDLTVLARLMAAQNSFGPQKVAQMSLMRNAVNLEEVKAGGLYELRRRDFMNEGQWMSQRAYFTTNPSLMTITFMRDHHWPVYEKDCEGRFTHDLLDRGFVFGVYGDGTEYVEHVGDRTGFGY